MASPGSSSDVEGTTPESELVGTTPGLGATSEYYTPQLQLGVSDGPEELIEASKPHWSEQRSDGGLEGKDPEQTNGEIFKWMSKQPEFKYFFQNEFRNGDIEIGKLIAEGGQSEILEGYATVENSRTGKFKTPIILKVFKSAFSLEVLQRQWPQGMTIGRTTPGSFEGGFHCAGLAMIYGGMVLEDDRFAFIIQREGIDLRRFLEVYQDKRSFKWGVHTKSWKDFQSFRPHLHRYEWEEGKPGILNAKMIVYKIAVAMLGLHQRSIIHRDLKASNVLISDFEDGHKTPGRSVRLRVADFECSMGVVGTGFWRAPEILQQLKDRKPEVQFSPESDVYSFGMTCYEVLTGGIPLGEERLANYNVVIMDEVRPELPDTLPNWMKELIEKCWHPIPSSRPNFEWIVSEIEKQSAIDQKQRSSRSFSLFQ